MEEARGIERFLSGRKGFLGGRGLDLIELCWQLITRSRVSAMPSFLFASLYTLKLSVIIYGKQSLPLMWQNDCLTIEFAVARQRASPFRNVIVPYLLLRNENRVVCEFQG